MEKLIPMDVSFRRSILFRSHFIWMLSLVTALLFPWHNATAAPGDLDPNFGNGGTVTTTSLLYHVRAIELQQDGKIVMLTQDSYGFSAFPPAGGSKLSRYLPNGTIDSTFGDGGIVTLPSFHDGYLRTEYYNVEFYDFVIKKNGEILLFGRASHISGRGTLLKQLKSDGQIDTTFGKGTGHVLNLNNYYTDNEVRSVVLQQDERIIIVNRQWKFSRYVDPYIISLPNTSVMRLRSDGSLDTSFGGGDGQVEIPAEAHIYIHAISIDRTSDNITIGGIDGTFIHDEGFYTTSGLGQLKIIRLTKDGVLDKSFDNDGIVTFGYGSNGSVLDLEVTPTGKVLVVAYASGKILARFNKDGSLDNGFIYRPGTQPPHSIRSVYNIQLLAGGKLLLAGDLFATRHHWSGALDNRFGGGDGYIDLAGFFQELALQPNGKIVAVSDSSNDSIVLQRFLNDPTDLTPNAMRFANRSGVAPQSMVTSNPITVTGITADTFVPVNISGGSYSVNNRPFTNKPGWVKKGDVIRIKHKASSRSNAKTKSTLTVGGLQSQTNMALVLGKRTTATFSSKTRP